MMTERDKGLLALAALQAGVLAIREKLFAGEDIPEPEEVAGVMADQLRELDFYLTGSDANRRRDSDIREFLGVITEVDRFLVHLSDGGYSRITISPEDGQPVRLDYGLSTAKVKERWEKLFP